MKKSEFEAIFVARQPIFTRTLDVWGYELLFRSSKESTQAIICDEAAATSSVLADGLTAAVQGMPQDRKVLVNFPESMLATDAAYALPSDRGVVEILEHVDPTEEVVSALKALRKEGYTIALDDYTGQREIEPFIALADIVKIDILGMDNDLDAIAKLIDGIPDDKIILAEKVEEQEIFHALRELRFSLFQGFFFSRPEVVSGKKLTSGQISRIQIMDELGKPDISLHRLSEILSTDPSLSYRLFRYINSASFSLSVTVQSIDRAVSMLGTKQIAQWLKSAILSDMASTPRSTELALLSVHRARFFELLCEDNATCAIGDQMFTIGLFSLLDAMLDIRMSDILKELPLDKNIVDALTGKSKLHKLLMLTHSLEHGYWSDCERRMESIKLDPRKVYRLYAQARNWASSVTGSMS